MELIVISESKLKIMLTAPDMAHYELEGSPMDCADAHTRAAFRHIFDDARQEIGFDTEGERLFIQLYASKEGGCEIFVTKLGAEGDLLPLPSESVKTPTAVAVGGLTHAERELLERVYALDEEGTAPGGDRWGTWTAGFRFDALGDLLAVCRRLGGAGFYGESRAYIEELPEGDRWYLLLSVTERGGGGFARRYGFLSEYGEEVEPAGAELYLGEHGDCLCPARAVPILSAL